ncbi:MAG: tetratricopeptide repeat protein [Cyanobacteriota bacterium]
MTASLMTFDNPVKIDTKIAFSFYDLGVAYERRNRYELAIENYKKSLDYDSDLHMVKLKIEELKEKIKNTRYFKQSASKIHAVAESINCLYW